jgi:hypothetical protein
MKCNKKQQTKKALIGALKETLGVVTAACEAVGVDRATFYRYYNDDEDFQKEVKDMQEYALDFAESALFKSIKKGSDTATIFFLKTKGKDRGYIEKQEIQHNGNIKHVHEHTAMINIANDIPWEKLSKKWQDLLVELNIAREDKNQIEI